MSMNLKTLHLLGIGVGTFSEISLHLLEDLLDIQKEYCNSSYFLNKHSGGILGLILVEYGFNIQINSKTT